MTTTSGASPTPPRTPRARDLTLEQRASLTSGADAWHLQGIAQAGIEGPMITDGPHGLRKARNDAGLDVTDSIPATCFPPAAGLSSSWNPDLVREVGRAMGEECRQEKVAVILGPGINIKRSPLGGRNFEYWSEDPVVAGHLASALVDGVQSQGIGTSLKHFAVNSQETDRMRVSARLNERALREIYLSAFEEVVTRSHPWTVMCSYNKVNGTYASQNRWLLTDVLRKEWGFTGIVMSDWGAVHDRGAALAAGLNLEMPPSGTDAQVVAAVESGDLDEDQLTLMAQGMIDLQTRATETLAEDGYTYDVDAHHAVAARAARESVVLLKNEGEVLPLDATRQRIGVIGEFARTPRYQGGGSSHITPTRLTSFLDALALRGIDVDFAPGFTLDDSPQDPALRREAQDVARRCDVVLLFLGLPDAAESEGFDRKSLDLPTKQVDLVRALTAVNPRTVVVLSNGAVVSVAGWQDRVAGLVEGWLLGQAGGIALADVLLGDHSPSGHLTETIPLSLADEPSYLQFPGGEGVVDYGEGVFVGYRHFDSVDRKVAYPFGFGLSYTTFEVVDAHASVTGATSARVEVRVRNTGTRPGAHVVQLYVAPPATTPVPRPVHELREFVKVELAPGEEQSLTMDLPPRAFAYWSEAFGTWHVPAGRYVLQVASSSRDIDVELPVVLDGDGLRAPLTEMSTVGEWLADPVGGEVLRAILAQASAGGGASSFDIESMEASAGIFLTSLPLATLAGFSGESGHRLVDAVMQATKEATSQQ